MDVLKEINEENRVLNDKIEEIEKAARIKGLGTSPESVKQAIDDYVFTGILRRVHTDNLKKKLDIYDKQASNTTITLETP